MATTSSFSFLSEIDPNARAVAAQAEALLHVDPPACSDGAQVDAIAGASRQDGVVPQSTNERRRR